MSLSALLPGFGPARIILSPETLRYNPCDDLIFPSILKTGGRISGALGAYYLYYAPHDAPGGICLAYADHPEGPWTEYAENPILSRKWYPHYEVSHISSPHALWMASASRLYLYFHGENNVTRLASSRDGIRFDYEAEVVSTGMYEGISESSYARVFPCEVPSEDASYVLLFMGNNGGTRRIYAAWSQDGKTFRARKAPLIHPPPGSGVTQVGAPWLHRAGGRNLVLFHGDRPQAGEGLKGLTTDLYAADVGTGFDREEHLGIVYSRLKVSASNMRASDPCLFEEGGRTWLFLSVGGRLKQRLAVAGTLPCG